ncbi:hypothetical protein V5E97_10185 [Singulisphaera sp. Ch08]|uniref:Uncharacterized protein n=1 Tax=Singulisphaera sp. Ch08 TaxID=3120278 RepID=A0AAU7CLK1_9BACT
MSTRGYLEIYQARRNGNLYAQAESFLLVKAIPDIRNEDPGTANHAARIAWADAAEASEAGLELQVRRLLTFLVQNPTIAAAAASAQLAEDSDVEYVGLQNLAPLVALNA